MALTTKITLRVNANRTNALDHSIPADALDFLKTFSWATGVALDQADLMFSDQRTLASGASEEMDLAGVLTDGLGATLTFARIKLLFLFSAVVNPGNINVGGAAANGFSTPFLAAANELVLRPGGFLVLGAPDATAYVVTAATGDLLRLEEMSSGGAAIYDIVLIGASV